jgi:choline-phosphate cytidylyltransferase
MNLLKKIGRFKFIKRTEGISTTDLIMRIIKEYDEYVRRNLKRGCSRKDLNVGLLKEKQIIYGSKIKELKKKATEELEEIKEKFEENHLFEFLKKFGKIFEGETFPC